MTNTTTDTVRLYQIPGSPNNIKVRIGLGYKQIPYSTWDLPMDTPPPFDRSVLLEISGQPRTPVLQHGDAVLFDSSAILRYLDANFRATPPLFSRDYDEFAVIEDWELYSRTALGTAVRAVFRQCFAPQPDLGACREASAQLHAETARLEAALASRPFAVRDTLSAADCACAPMVGLGMVEEAEVQSPVGEFFRAHFHLGEGRERTREWVRRVRAFDRG